MFTRHRVLTAVLVLALLVTPFAVTAQDPRFEAYVSNPTLTPGKVNEVTVQLVNDAADPRNRVETARNLRVSVDDDDRPYSVLSGTQVVGEVADGQTVSVTLRIRVPGDIEGGTHTLPLDLRYESNTTDHSVRQFTEVRVEDRPRFEVREVDATAAVGGSGTVTLVAENVGERTARRAQAMLESRSADVAFGGSNSASRYVDEWDPGETRTLEYDASVSGDADTRSYPLQFSVSYTDEDGNDGTSSPESVGMTPLPEQTFGVRNLEADLRVGSDGTLRGEVVNTGNRTARNAVVVFGNSSGAVTPTETEYAVGTLEPDQRASFDFGVAVDGDADAGPRQFHFRVRYRNPDDERATSDDIDVPVTVGGGARFEVANVDSGLRVGAEGELRGQVINRGDTPVRNAVVVFEQPSGTVSFAETEYAVGDLAPGERANFSFDAEVTDEADAGPRQFVASVRYRGADGEQRESDSDDVRVDVAPAEPEFDVTPINATFAAGDGGEFRIEITNARARPLTDVSAKIYPEAPLSSDDDEAFVERLEPGNSTELVFGVGAGGTARKKTYPLKLDFQYENPDGDTQISETYRVPVEVTADENGGLPIPLVAGAVLVVLVAAGAVLYRRRY